MTAQEMQKSFMQQLSAMGVEHTIPSEDVMLYLNKAVDQFVKEKFNSRSNRLRQGFEQSPKRLEDLRELIVTAELDCTEVSQGIMTDIYMDKADIPSDHFLLISVGLKVFFNVNGISFTVNNSKREPDGTLNTDYGEMRVPAKFVQHDDIYSVLDDPFNKPRIRKGVFTVDDGSIYSYTDDSFVTDKIVVTYLKEPATISIDNQTDCDLANAAHEDVVDLAAMLFANDKGLKTQRQRQQQQES